MEGFILLSGNKSNQTGVLQRISYAIFKDKRPAVIISLVVIFILGAYLRFDFITSVKHNVTHDTKGYDILVRQLFDDGVYAYKDTKPNAQVTPGYPIFMAAVYKMVDYQNHDPYPYIRYIQVGISLLTMYIIYRLARRLGGAGVGIAATAITAIYPSFVWSNGAVLTEVLCTFFLTLYLYVQVIAFEKKTWPYALGSGLLLGLTVLVRPEFLPLIVVCHAVAYLWKRNWKEIGKLLVITSLGLGIALSPWVIRNIITLNKVVVASTQVNPFAAGTYPNKNYDDDMVDRKGKTQMEVAKERLYVGFTQHTWEYVQWYTVGKLVYTYGKMFFGAGHSPYYEVIPLLPRNGLHWLLIGFFPVTLVACIRRWREPAFMFVTVIVAMSMVRLLFVPETRYNYTVMPLIIILDCLVAAGIIKWFKQRKQPVIQQK